MKAKIIVSLIVLLLLAIAVLLCVYLIKQNKKLKKENKRLKETHSVITEKEKEYGKIKEEFIDTDTGGQSIVDFLHNHKRG